MRRRSELCSFRFEDLVLNPNGKFGIRLNHSKTNQFGMGKLQPISKELHELIKDWEEVAIDGHILRGVKPSSDSTQKLSPGSVSIIFKILNRKQDSLLNYNCRGILFKSAGHSIYY